MKKVYYIKQPPGDATPSGQWRNTLKQTYKSSDAIRDIIAWAEEGREFYVAITDTRGTGRRHVYHINPPGARAMFTDFATKRPVVGVIDLILSWAHEGIEFDITLLERCRGEEGGGAPDDDGLADADTPSARLRLLRPLRN